MLHSVHHSREGCSLPVLDIMKPSTSRYFCPDGHVTTECRTIHEDTITCTHPRLGDDTDPLIDNADICGKKATRSDKR